MKMYIENLSIGAVIWLSMILNFMEMVSVVLVVVRDDDLIEGVSPSIVKNYGQTLFHESITLRFYHEIN